MVYLQQGFKISELSQPLVGGISHISEPRLISDDGGSTESQQVDENPDASD